MKKSILPIVVIALFIGVTSFKNAPSKTSGASEFKTSFTKALEGAKAYTLEVAEAMPAEDYTFKTTDSVKSFGEQLAHLGMSSQFILTKLINGQDMPESDVTEEQIGASKEMTIALLNDTFDKLITSLNGMDDDEINSKFVVFFAPDKPELTKQEGFVFLRDHITHHRAQAIVYLRIKGHKAPSYRAF